MKRIQRAIAFLAATCALAASAAATSEPASTLPAPLRDAGIEQRIGDRVPGDVRFRDETGREVRLDEYLGGEPVILVPMYYRCPMLCGVLLEGVVKSLKVLTFGADTDYRLVAFSFNPEEGPADAAGAKRRAAELFDRPGAQDGWHFLTGDAEAVARLTNAIGFRASFDETRGEYIHAATILLLTPDGTIARYFYGVDFPPKDLRLGLVEASRSELGTVVDQVLLYCYRYDPTTGKYSLLTMRVLRIGALVTVLGLALMITVLVRLEKRTSKVVEG